MSFKGIDAMRMKMRSLLLSMAVVLSAYPANAGPVAPDPVVGTWLVEQPAVPFPLHLYVFNADYTMQQANPDAGNPRTSDSDGIAISVAT